MKYSKQIGVIAAIGLIVACFFPWVYIESINTTITGINAQNTNFGRPGLISIIFALFSISLCAIQKIWSKRLNLFVSTFNFAWSIRNFLLITQCSMGECPVKKPAIFATLLFSLIILIMSMVPKMEIKNWFFYFKFLFISILMELSA